MNVSSMLNSLPRKQTGDDKNGIKVVVITMITTDKDNQKTVLPSWMGVHSLAMIGSAKESHEVKGYPWIDIVLH